MDLCEKVCLLNSLIAPFGFSYSHAQNIITSRVDAWQKDFGYCSLYDKGASHFNMVFDCEPVYFQYDNRTWLIEFWKGQYGINIGAEVGVYRADTVIPADKLQRTVFYGIPEQEMFPISMELSYRGESLFGVRQPHWWLTGFRMGSYCEPEELSLNVSLTFPDSCMLHAFVDSMIQLGYQKHCLTVCGLTVSFCFSIPKSSQPRRFFCIRARISQWKNRIFCRIYNRVTLPFACTLDQLLYLYAFLPYAFRHMLRFQKHRKQKLNKRYCKKHCKKQYRKHCRTR